MNFLQPCFQPECVSSDVPLSRFSVAWRREGQNNTTLLTEVGRSKKKKVNTKATPRTSEKTLLFYLRIQHISGNKATYRNIIGRKFCHPVQCAVLRRDVCCWPNLKMVKFFIQQLRMLRDVVLVWPCCGRARALVRFVTPNVSQHVATPNMSQHVTTGLANTGSTVLRSLN